MALDLVSALVLVAFAGLELRTLAREPARRPFAAIARFLAVCAVSASFALVGMRDLFAGVRVLAVAVFFAAPLALVGLASVRRGAIRVASVALAAVLVAIAFDAFLLEPRALEVTRTQVASARATRVIRVAVVADIQTDAPGAYEAGALARVREAAPDLVVFPGDFVQAAGGAYVRAERTFREIVRAARLRPRLGAFAVGGNVDPPGWERLFEGTGVEALPRGGQKDLGELVLTGLDLASSFDRGRVVERVDDRLHVVFGHAPDFALGHVDADVLLAGHVHGGQVRLPFLGPLVTLSSVPRELAVSGHRLASGAFLYVSRGIGMERGNAPRLRFLCPPEVAILDVLPR